MHNTVPILAQCIDSDMILVSQIKHQFGYLLPSGLNWDANGMRGLKGILPPGFHVWNSSMYDGCRFPLFIIKVAPRPQSYTFNRPIKQGIENRLVISDLSRLDIVCSVKIGIGAKTKESGHT